MTFTAYNIGLFVICVACGLLSIKKGRRGSKDKAPGTDARTVTGAKAKAAGWFWTTLGLAIILTGLRMLR